MAWRLALRAEVGAGPDQAGAEELLPQAIHCDTGGQRMIAVYQPMGKVEAGWSSTFGNVQRRQRGRYTGFDFIARLVILPSGHYESITCHVAVGKSQRP